VVSDPDDETLLGQAALASGIGCAVYSCPTPERVLRAG
jgi:hypothetical protein